MNIVFWNKLSTGEQTSLLARTVESFTDVAATVESIMENVKANGDRALAELTARFDGAAPAKLLVDAEEIARAGDKVPADVRAALEAARTNIESYHRLQLPSPYEVETAPGVRCRREWRPIDRVGLYIPGGSAPLVSTVLMLGIPARIAGCPEIILCTPPMRNGSVAPSILYAANLLGITSIAAVGGAQAVAAMAMGTDIIAPVQKIFGPGNRFVAAAKQLVSQPPYNVAIDVMAGPTELLVVADESAPAGWIAADLLAQAEHGPDSHVLLLTPSEAYARQVSAEVDRIADTLSRKKTALAAIAHSAIAIVKDVDEAITISNRYAPEHLILAVDRADSYLSYIRSAGSVFVGSDATAVFGDYASGTNHTLPTAGAARTAGGVTVESFMKPIFFQTLTRSGYDSIAGVASTLARAEGLDGHACAVDIRRTPSAQERP